MTKEELNLYERLGVGRENAKKSTELGLNSRAIRRLTADMRKKGIAICSGDEGYWIAGSEAEKEHTIAILKAKGAELFRVARGMENAEVQNGSL